MLFESQIRDILDLLPWRVAQKEKTAMRALVEQKRRIYPKESIESDSAAIMSQLERMAAFRDAKSVLIYYPIHNEVDLRPLLEKYYNQKIMLLPVTHRHSMEVRPYDGVDMLKRGHFNVPEPQTAPYKGSIDLIIVPGVVFDVHLHRIGRGGGYYDKFLRKYHHANKFGVCYEFQLKKHDIPHNWRDAKMDRVITPLQTIE